MTDAEALAIVRRHLESLFPMTCPTCGHAYATLRDYVRTTTPVGRAISYDAEAGAWDTAQPVGTLALANCVCGSTLGLSTRGMPLSQRLTLLGWMKAETERRGIGPSDLLEELREGIRRQVTGEPAV